MAYPTTAPNHARRHWLHNAAAALAGLVLASAVLSPDTAQAATETRPVAPFTAVQVSGPFDVRLSQGSTASLTLDGEPDALARVETVQEGDRIVLRLKRNALGWVGYSGPTIQVTLVTPQLRSVSTAGSGEIRLGPFTTPSLSVSISGSGDTRFEPLVTPELNVSISGSGAVRGSGEAARLAVSIAGSGDVRLAEVKAEAVSVKIAGSGDAAVNAARTLDVSIASSGDVRYAGNPQIKLSRAGSGSVTPLK
jgi:carbon monoxide dehydrogenase subunit G